MPVDGVVLVGRSTIDESMINGEPVPSSKSAGSAVVGATLNQSGSFTVRAEHVGAETLLHASSRWWPKRGERCDGGQLDFRDRQRAAAASRQDGRHRMKLLRDEQAYRQIVDDFVARRLDAGNFIVRFQKLWDCDRAEGIAGVLAMQRSKSGLAGLYGFLDSVSALCATYLRNLLPTGGYRVSEEQFRKEIEGMVRAWPDPSQSDVRPGHWRDGQHHLF